jgi:hypothetical protein
MENKILTTAFKDQYILPALQKLPYRFKVFVSSGAYKSAYQKGNLRAGTINALCSTTNSEIVVLGGNIPAVAVNMTLRMLVPIPDETNEENEYAFLDELRENLIKVFGTSSALNLSVDGVSYVGAVFAGYPMDGELLQRQKIGKSFEYTVYFQFSYLQNAVNSTAVTFHLDGETTPLPVTSWSFSRRNTLSASLLSSSLNGESQTYGENSTFGVDLSLPMINPANGAGVALWAYLSGYNANGTESNNNTPHTLKIQFTPDFSIEKQYVFGEVSVTGGGTDNVSAKISFVPYLEAEDVDDTEGA